MADATLDDHRHAATATSTAAAAVTNDFNSSTEPLSKQSPKSRQRSKELSTAAKRRCVSTACIACRRRKSKVRHMTLLSVVADIMLNTLSPPV